jgi:putative endonuclease
MSEKQPAVYILASRRDGVLYTGVTGNLVKRVWEHKQGITGGFSAKYHVHRLVWYELGACMEAAIKREKQIKAGSREKKIALIQSMNPEWRDLYDTIVG